jgi:hypothetical protein
MMGHQNWLRVISVWITVMVRIQAPPLSVTRKDANPSSVRPGGSFDAGVASPLTGGFSLQKSEFGQQLEGDPLVFVCSILCVLDCWATNH